MQSNEINEKFNFNKAVFPGIQGGPLMHVIAGKAVCFKEALTPEFKAYQEQVVKNAAKHLQRHSWQEALILYQVEQTII